MDGNFEVPFGAFNLFNLGTGDQVDVKVPADLDQFWRDNSHSAVIGGERLIKLAHYTADGG